MPNKKDPTKPVKVTISKLERLLKARKKHVKDEAKERAVVDAAIEREAEMYEKRGRK